MLLWFHQFYMDLFMYVCVCARICAILLFIFILSCLFLIYFLRLLCCGPFLKPLLIFTILLLFYVLVFWPWGMWDPNSPTWDGTHTPCIGRWSLNHWTAREVSVFILLFITYLLFSTYFIIYFKITICSFITCANPCHHDQNQHPEQQMLPYLIPLSLNKPFLAPLP